MQGMDAGEILPSAEPTLGIEIWHSMGFPYGAVEFRIYILSVRRRNGVDDNGGIGPCRLLGSRAYPIFDPGGDAGRRGTSHDRLRSVACGNISGGAEFGAAGVGGGAIVIAILVKAGMPEAVV